MTFRKHTTVVEVMAQMRRHELADFADRIAMCSCGRWFDTTQAFNSHQRAEVEMQLTASQPRAPQITREILAEVAEIHRGAPDGQKIRKVSEFLGVSTRSAGTYVTRARKAGLLEPAA